MRRLVLLALLVLPTPGLAYAESALPLASAVAADAPVAPTATFAGGPGEDIVCYRFLGMEICIPN